MTKLYFLDGLGSNPYYAEDLRLALAAKELDLIYLPLPGHPENLDALPTSKEDLLDWIGSVLPETPCTLLGYSLGADLARAEREAYAFDETSGLFRLKLNPDAVKALLTYRREFGLSLQATDFVSPTHLIISGQPDDLLHHKLAILAAAAPCVSYEVVEGAGHDFYIVYPDQTADRIVRVLDKEG